ncbi:glycoside hydrolase family 3 C-terminal domain-containing protein [Halarchaeum sp. P4]|uniref:glycoside hydrolase family 3 C-terminal domain-containing protein n=1 Tax=Halarchaeum sp. P4 TaxID=3421639 RepID=UPI003EC121BE
MPHDDTLPSLDLSRRRVLQTTGAAAVASTLLVNAAPAAAAEDASRVDSLVEQLTLDEKIQLVHGHEGPATGYIPPVERLGIPDLKMSDGPLGVRNGESTAFPATVGLAASFDRERVTEEGSAMGREARAKDQDVLLAPAMNLARVPVNGRTFEYFGEDPFLAGELAAAFTDGAQSEDVIATAKHFVANNQEDNRGGPLQELPGVSVDVSERALRECYLPAFRAAVQEGGVGAIMAAYNRVNGTYMTEHDVLLQEVLKDEWGFDGFVMSDWGATHDAVDAANGGLDLDMPGTAYPSIPGYFDEELKTAVQQGLVSEERLNEMVRRILRQMERFGVLDRGDDAETPSADYDAHRELSRELAEDGAVLLKNENDVLPLDAASIDSLALVGSDPRTFRIGGGGSSNVDATGRVGPVEGIRNLVGDDVEVTVVDSDGYRLVDAEHLSTADGEPGLTGHYYDSTDFSGSAVATRVDDHFRFSDDNIDVEGIDPESFSARWTGTLTAPASGTFEFALTSQNASSLTVDGETVVDNGGGFLGTNTVTGNLDLQQGETYDVTLEVANPSDSGETILGLQWSRPDVDPVQEASDAAANADAAVVLAKGSSTESSDRDDMTLDGNQNDVVAAVADANETTVALLNTGGPITMPWLDAVPSVLELWYPGQEGGAAAANLLFGEAEPGGRLPLTFGKSMDDYPADEIHEYPGENNVVHYDEGVFVGYRWFDQQETEPLFAFGHGETYTDFEYADASLSRRKTTPDAGVTVSVDVTNTGDREGTETVQVYVREVDPAVERPPRELKGFANVTVPAGETKTVEVELGRDAFQYWDPETEEWTVNDGAFEVEVAASSRDVRATKRLTVAGGAGTAASPPSNAPDTPASENASEKARGADKGGDSPGRSVADIVARLLP